MLDIETYNKIIDSPPFRQLEKILFFVSMGNYNVDLVINKLFFKTKRIKDISNFPIIFIGGCMRSGTTLARSLIGMHPQIIAPQRECYLFNLQHISRLKSTLQISNLLNEYKDNYNNNYLRFTEHFLNSYINQENKPYVALKAPIYVNIVKELHQIFPKMKFIHVIRDGRDVVCSIRKFPSKIIVDGKIIPIDTKNPFPMCVKKWVTYVKAGIKSRGSDRYIELRYEDLVNSTVEMAKNLFQFLDLDMPDEKHLLNFYKHEVDEMHIHSIEVGKPIFKSSIGRWKKDMSDHEKKYFKKIAGKLLIELGYEKDCNW